MKAAKKTPPPGRSLGDLREQMIREYAGTRDALGRLVIAGCDERDLLRRCWSVALDHGAYFDMLAAKGSKPKDTQERYGLPKWRVRELPDRLRRSAEDIERLNRAPALVLGFTHYAADSTHDVSDEEALLMPPAIRNLPSMLVEYASLLEKAYRWAAKNVPAEFNPSSLSEFQLVRFVRRELGTSSRTPFADIATLLDAMVNILLSPGRRLKYATKIDGETLRKRTVRFSALKKTFYRLT